MAGDETVVVTWTPPADPGSAAITTYEVAGTPNGSCTVDAPATTCEITGLTNGDTYFFVARARNSFGWSTFSRVSDPVVPKPPPPPPPPPPPVDPTILITGTRSEVRGKPGIIVRGTTAGLTRRTVLVPWIRFPGQPDYSAGVARIRLQADGDLRWQRRTGKKIYVSIRTADNEVWSNRLIIRGRR